MIPGNFKIIKDTESYMRLINFTLSNLQHNAEYIKCLIQQEKDIDMSNELNYLLITTLLQTFYKNDELTIKVSEILLKENINE